MVDKGIEGLRILTYRLGRVPCQEEGVGKEISLEVETVGLESEGRDGVGRCLVARERR